MLRLIAPLLVALWLCAGPARADWMNLTGAETAPNIAEITIEDDRVRLVLEIYIGDLDTFRDLVPDDWLQDAAADRPELRERLRHFSSEVFRLVTASGDSLPAELGLVEPRLRKDRFSRYAGMINPSTRQKVPEAPEDKRVLYVELEYPFASPPDSLTIIPPLDKDGVATANIGFIAYHKAVPIIDFRYLSGPVTVKLNWDDPWYSRFENPNLKRHHESALMSYLYVEPREVRHEVVTRIKDLENWIDLGLRGDRYIEPDEWATLQARVAEFFLSRNKVAIDGESVDLAVDRTSFLALGLQGVQALEQPERLEISTAIVGVALAYAIEAMPDEVTVDWELFSDEITRVPSTAVDPAGPFMSFADPDDPVIVWRNFLVDYREPAIEAVPLGFDRTLGLPLLSVVLLLAAIGAGGFAFKPRLLPRKAWLAMVPAGLLGAGLLSTVAVLEVENPLVGPPDQAATAEIVERLIGNLHAALEERDESRSRDALTVSVSEQALGAVLPELRRGLVIEIQGGRSARVGAVNEIVVKELQGLDAGAGFRALVEWSADASGWHWQHLHRRRMRFTALMDVMPVGDAWKLTGLTVISVQQES